MIVLDLQTIVKDYKFNSFPPQSIDNWISRGIEVETEITNFLFNNLENRRIPKKPKHAFLYCVNGSGMGKTWTGYYVTHRLISLASTTNHVVIPCILDFSSGFGWNDSIDHLPAIALGLRIAAALIFNCSLNDVLMIVPVHQRPAFSFESVMKWISRVVTRPPKSYILFAIHLDEIQKYPEPEKQPALLHIIANYMCSTVETRPSNTVQDRVIIYPIITGTSTKACKQEVTDYGVYKINLIPWNYAESLLYMKKRNIDCSNWLQHKGFKRLIKSCGGLPRCLDYLCAIIMKNPMQFEMPFTGPKSYFDQLVSSISTAYKFDDHERMFGGMDNLTVVIAMTINAVIVTLETKLYPKIVKDKPIEVTIEDVMKEGVIFIIPSAFHDGSYKVILPLVFLHCLNSKYAIFPYRLDEIFEKNWVWESFKEWDCKYQHIKNNSWFWLSKLPNIQNFHTNLGTLYSCKHPDSRDKHYRYVIYLILLKKPNIF